MSICEYVRYPVVIPLRCYIQLAFLSLYSPVQLLSDIISSCIIILSSAISRSVATCLPPVAYPSPPAHFFLSMVLSLSLVIMVQITGSREASHCGRGGNQTLQVGLCQQGRQPAAADRTQGKAAVSRETDTHTHECVHERVELRKASGSLCCLQVRKLSLSLLMLLHWSCVLFLQAAAGDGPKDREALEADVTKRFGQRERFGGSAQHRGPADQRPKKGKETHRGSSKRVTVCTVHNRPSIYLNPT